MTMPIIIYRPKVVVQPLDENGSPTSDEPVDVSCDFSSIEFGVDQPSTTPPSERGWRRRTRCTSSSTASS